MKINIEKSLKQLVALVLISCMMNACVPRKPLKPPPRPGAYNQIHSGLTLA